MSHTKFESATAHPELNDVQNIDPKELNNKASDVQLIDVRRPDEFIGQLGHIPGAELITLDTLEDNLGKLSKDKTIVFICRSGGRSANATQFVKSKGFTEAYNMTGGMILWNELGFDTQV